jgi:hypothetical protein
MPQYYSGEIYVQDARWVRAECAVNLLERSTDAWVKNIKLHDSNLDHKIIYKPKTPFPGKFVKRLNEPSVSRVAVWKQLRLNQWSVRSPHKHSCKWSTNLSIYMKASRSQMVQSVWAGAACGVRRVWQADPTDCSFHLYNCGWLPSRTESPTHSARPLVLTLISKCYKSGVSPQLNGFSNISRFL